MFDSSIRLFRDTQGSIVLKLSEKRYFLLYDGTEDKVESTLVTPKDNPVLTPLTQEEMDAFSKVFDSNSTVAVDPHDTDSLMSTLDGIKRYVNDHTPTGSFLHAVLTNNLKEAFSRADDENLNNMFAIVHYCYDHLPSICWGSEEKVAAWIEEGRKHDVS
jgi:hypothetical protein